MIVYQDCVQEVQALRAAKWKVKEVAQGGDWMEIIWRRGDEEDLLMMVYGREKIEAVAQLAEACQ